MDLKVQAELMVNSSFIRMIQAALCDKAYDVLSDIGGPYTDTHKEMATRAITKGTNVAMMLAPIIVTQSSIQNLLDLSVPGEVDILDVPDKALNEDLFRNDIVTIWLNLEESV